MTPTKAQIVSRLEQTFNTRGFAEPSVVELQKAAGVSLRTLYRYYPSKEAMVIGALDYRHDRYLAFLAENEPPPGKASIIHLFGRLADWMTSNAPNGCLSLNASRYLCQAVSRRFTTTPGPSVCWIVRR